VQIARIGRAIFRRGLSRS